MQRNKGDIIDDVILWFGGDSLENVHVTKQRWYIDHIHVVFKLRLEFDMLVEFGILLCASTSFDDFLFVKDGFFYVDLL